MNYVYDIVLNFQKKFYDFFEWNENDDILHIRRIPLFSVNDNDYINIKNNLLVFDKEFQNKIFNKAERFKNIYVSNIAYACLISNKKEVLAIKLNKNGFLIARSSLLFDEADDIIRISKNLDFSTIGYRIIKIDCPNNFKTRNEQNQELLIDEKIQTLIQRKEVDKLKFLFYECFGKENGDLNDIYVQLKKEIKDGTKNCQKISDFFKLISLK